MGKVLEIEGLFQAFFFFVTYLTQTKKFTIIYQQQQTTISIHQHEGTSIMARPRKATTETEVKETSASRFVRLANKRVPKALKALQAVRKLAGSTYKFTPDQAKKIVNSLNAEIEMVAKDFLSPRSEKTESNGWTL